MGAWRALRLVRPRVDYIVYNFGTSMCGAAIPGPPAFESAHSRGTISPLCPRARIRHVSLVAFFLMHGSSPPSCLGSEMVLMLDKVLRLVYPESVY